MNIFTDYANYYDLLYKDKDYLSEASYIDKIIRKVLPEAKSILNMGCGTGTHDFYLAEMGYRVTGIDNSEINIKKARSKLLSTSLCKSHLNFEKADIRKIQLNKPFDVVVSLFHVISYLNKNEDLEMAFETARAHLKKGGLFIFDCWYGPAVLTDRPSIRVKTVEDEKICVTRIAEPEMIPNDNVVNVNYRVIIKDKKTEKMSETCETHKLRYLFKPEVENLLARAGFAQSTSTEWMTDRSPGFDTWNIYFVTRAR